MTKVPKSRIIHFIWTWETCIATTNYLLQPAGRLGRHGVRASHHDGEV